MNRRDFLSFRTIREPEPTFDLECHALYMRYVDATRPGAAADASDWEYQQGEPAAALSTPSVDDLMADLERRLSQVRRLRVLDGEWLQTTGLGERVTPLLDRFRDRGGVVLFDSTAAY